MDKNHHIVVNHGLNLQAPPGLPTMNKWQHKSDGYGAPHESKPLLYNRAKPVWTIGSIR